MRSSFLFSGPNTYAAQYSHPRTRRYEISFLLLYGYYLLSLSSSSPFPREREELVHYALRTTLIINQSTISTNEFFDTSFFQLYIFSTQFDFDLSLFRFADTPYLTHILPSYFVSKCVVLFAWRRFDSALVLDLMDVEFFLLWWYQVRRGGRWWLVVGEVKLRFLLISRLVEWRMEIIGGVVVVKW